MTSNDAPVLEVADLRVDLGGRTILRDASFSVGAGEFVGLIGANGAGKTTLLRVILGLVAPGAGSVRVTGQREGRGALVGYVPQAVALDPEMPIRARDLVAMGLDGHRWGFAWPSRKRAARVDEMLAAVGATAFADARVGSLSGGEQRRVLIAHALIGRPRLLLLDEPLANLDLRSEHEIVSLVSRLAVEHGVTALVSAHDMNPLLPVMDQVIYVAGGRVACGPTRDVVTTESLTSLYGHRVDVIDVHGRVLVVSGRENEGLHGHGDDEVHQ
jgi:zinc/manganese transport system ATP-binding protein